MKQVKSNRVCFTLNNYSDEEVETLCNWLDSLNDKLLYAVIGQEIGETGTPHLQGFISICHTQLKAKDGLVRWWKSQPGLGRSHLEASRGNDFENEIYCTKDGPWISWGEPRLPTKDAFETIVEACKMGDQEGALGVSAELALKVKNKKKYYTHVGVGGFVPGDMKTSERSYGRSRVRGMRACL